MCNQRESTWLGSQESAATSTLAAVATEAVLYVRDLEPMAALYRQCIGLMPVETGDGYCGLRADAVTLWLVRQRQSPGGGADRDGPVRRRSEVPVKLAFDVGSIEKAGSAIAAFGASVTPTSWEFGGYRRRDAIDPEGNVIQLLEPLAISE
jgi:predicted enzyme related to lactoylglutathione lyase